MLRRRLLKAEKMTRGGHFTHPIPTADWRNVRLPPTAERMTKGDDDDKRRTFPPPRRRWQAVPLHTTPHFRQGGYVVSQERHTMVRASASPSECSECSEISDCFADARPKKPQCVKIRLNHQIARNLHAPLISPHYLCTKIQNAYWPHWPYWPYKSPSK